MKRFPPTLRCAQGRSLLGPKRKPLTPLLYAKRKKSQAAYAKSADGGNMTKINIIGVVMLVGSVLGYGALFLWVLTADKRKARKEGEQWNNRNSSRSR